MFGPYLCPSTRTLQSPRVPLQQNTGFLFLHRTDIFTNQRFTETNLYLAPIRLKKRRVAFKAPWKGVDGHFKRAWRTKLRMCKGSRHVMYRATCGYTQFEWIDGLPVCQQGKKRLKKTQWLRTPNSVHYLCTCQCERRHRSAAGIRAGWLACVVFVTTCKRRVHPVLSHLKPVKRLKWASFLFLIQMEKRVKPISVKRHSCHFTVYL